LGDPLPLGWPLLLESTGRSLSLVTPEKGRREIPATLDRPSIHDQLIPRPRKPPSRLRSREHTGEEILHHQPGFSISKTDARVTTRIDLDEMSSKPKSASKTKMLEDEVNRLGMLLKAEQHAHEQTKINAQSELDRYREQLEQEKDLAIKGVIDEYMRLNLEQRDSMNREQMAQNRGTSSEIRRLENELKDTQVAFDIFQANCRDDFEAKLKETKAEMEVLRLKELREHDERAAARLKARLAEQRGDLEADFNDTLLKIENKQKHELESMMSKLNNTNEDLAQMRDTEAKAANLSTRCERQAQRIADLEKQNKDFEKKANMLKTKIQQWELNSKNSIELAVAKHVTENEKLLEEIAQLRTRLVAKAETIGAMQFSNRMANMTSNMGGDVTSSRQARPKSFQELRKAKETLSGILKIQQIEEGTH